MRRGKWKAAKFNNRDIVQLRICQDRESEPVHTLVRYPLELVARKLQRRRRFRFEFLPTAHFVEVGHLVATLGLIFIFRIALDFVDGFTAQAGHQKIVPKSGD